MWQKGQSASVAWVLGSKLPADGSGGPEDVEGVLGPVAMMAVVGGDVLVVASFVCWLQELRR